MSQTLLCSRCDLQKYYLQFAKQPNTSSRSRVCRRCSRERQLLQAGTKTCRICKQVKPLDEFPKGGSGPLGLGSDCKPCKAAYNRRYTSPEMPRVRDSDESLAAYAKRMNLTPEDMVVVARVYARWSQRDPSPLDIAARTGEPAKRQCNYLAAAHLLHLQMTGRAI